MQKARKPQYFTSIKQFKFIQNKQIGKGSFGQVRPAVHILTNKLYAVKIIDSNEITTQVGVKALERETSIHPSIDHPHIVKLWQVLQEDSKTYMVMQFAEKGNLFYYQNKRKALSEEEVFNFFTQTLSAVQYMHNLNIVHRDLKPQNLLLDKDLNIKICDLGWVVEGIQDRHTTFCGTYEYMAPQMIFNGEYDFRVDVWALGVLLYEMLHGFAPFEGAKADEVRQSMLNGEIHIDPQLSQSSQDLIFNILKVQPDERLTIQQIKSHQWINEMKSKKENAMFQNFDNSNRESIEKIQQSKDHLKGLSKRLMEIMKQNKKPSTSQIKNNFSAEQLNIRKSLKQKGDTVKQVRQGPGKKIFGYHHTQNLSVSEIAKKQRLKTETNEKSFRPEIIRFNTQMGQNTVIQNRTIKKKKIPQKNLPFATNLLKTTQKHKFVRKSID